MSLSQRTPDRSIKARTAEALSPDLLSRVHASLCRPEAAAAPGALVPAGPPRHEVPRTAADAFRLLAGTAGAYPVPDGYSLQRDRYAPLMRAPDLITGTPGLGQYWQAPVAFTAPAARVTGGAR